MESKGALGEPDLISRARRRASSAAYAPALQRLRRECDAYVRQPLLPSPLSAGWFHDYFCPSHGAPLIFDPARPRAHRCSVARHDVQGERYDGGWRWHLNDQLSSAAFSCGLGWQLMRDRRYLARATEILRGYALHYDGYRSERDGKATFQALDESIWLIDLCWSYHWVQSELPSDLRAQIRDKLIEPAAYHILDNSYRRIHNIECWNRSALLTASLLLEDRRLRQVALSGPFGWRAQLKRGVRPDGIWWEGSPSYHYYALWAALWAARAYLPLQANSRLKKMLKAPLNLAYPDLGLPALNDAWPGMRLDGALVHGAPDSESFYELGQAWNPDPEFAALLRTCYRQSPRDSQEALLYGARLPRKSLQPPPSRKSVRLSASGFAILRPPPPQFVSFASLKFGAHGGGHGHADKLSTCLYLAGERFAVDPGTAGYSSALNESWYRATQSHNTVLVDGAAQSPNEGQLIDFHRPETRSFGLVDAAVAWRRGSYRGVRMRRALITRPDYLLDVFWAEATAPRRFTWLMHVNAIPILSKAGRPKASVRLDGLAEISGLRRLTDPISEWKVGHRRIAVHCLESGGVAYLGSAPSNPPHLREAVLVRELGGRAVAFVTLYADAAANIRARRKKAARAGKYDDLEIEIDGRVDSWRIPREGTKTCRIRPRGMAEARA